MAKKLFISFCLLLGVLLCSIVFFVGYGRKLIVSKTSPQKTWQVDLYGTRLLMGGIEITAKVIADNKQHSLGVVTLCSSWREAEYKFKEDVINRLQVDEVKATFDGRLVIRDRYLKGVSHQVSGTIQKTDVTFPIGEVTLTGFLFQLGTSVGRDPHLQVMVIDLEHPITQETTIFFKEPGISPPLYVNAQWRDEETGEMQNSPIQSIQLFEMHFHSVTEHVIEGDVAIIAEDPPTDLTGHFRLVNNTTSFPDVPIKTKLVQ